MSMRGYLRNGLPKQITVMLDGVVCTYLEILYNKLMPCILKKHGKSLKWDQAKTDYCNFAEISCKKEIEKIV